jgi:DNA-binding MarR family transcriptional regulator
MTDATSPPGMVNELRKQGEEMIRLGRQMVARASLLQGQQMNPSQSLMAAAESLMLAKETYDARQRRKSYFRDDLFGEPAWDILLDLYIQEGVGKRVSVTAACIGSGAPTATALRYIKLLVEDEGLVERRGDPKDGRRSWLSLTSQGAELMGEYLANEKMVPPPHIPKIDIGPI